MENIKTPRRWETEISSSFIHALFYFSLPFPVFSPPPHFNGATSRREEHNTTCMNICHYKSNFVPQLFSKIKMAPQSFCIIQPTCFAFWFGLHIGKLPSFDTKFAAIVLFLLQTRCLLEGAASPNEMPLHLLASCVMETRDIFNPLEIRKKS